MTFPFKIMYLAGPTVAHMKIEPAARNPIMLQGDHGPVAFRNIYIKEFEPTPAEKYPD
jgi:hypothetical protein